MTAIFPFRALTLINVLFLFRNYFLSYVYHLLSFIKLY
nr:MAG TPA: hypothetical protein [Caudoviricetes sp.]